MYSCIATITAAFVWMLYECDWLRLRMPVGPVERYCVWPAPDDLFSPEARLPRPLEPKPPIRLTREDFSSGMNPRLYEFSPGVDEPLCGWEWIEGRLHPYPDYRITITAWGVTSHVVLCSDSPKLARELFAAALKPTREQRKELNALKRANRKTREYPTFLAKVLTIERVPVMVKPS